MFVAIYAKHKGELTKKDRDSEVFVEGGHARGCSVIKNNDKT